MFDLLVSCGPQAEIPKNASVGVPLFYSLTNHCFSSLSLICRMQQQQQQRRMFTAALLALVFLLAAVSTTEAGKKEKPGKVQSNSELIPKTDCKCGRMSNAGFVVKFRSFVNLLTSQGRICGCDMLFCVKQGNRKGFPCQVAAWHPQRLESLVYHTQWILQSSLKCALWRV